MPIPRRPKPHRETKTEVLGDEYDAELARALLDVLVLTGATPVSSSRGVAGSQEVDRAEWDWNGTSLFIESETYVGLSLRGEPAAVTRIANAVRDRMSKRH